MRKLMRNIKNFIRGSILGIAGISLMACTAMFNQTLPPGGAVAESVITQCDTFAAALKSVTPLKATMTAKDVSIVNSAILLTSPICAKPSSYNANGALAGLKSETNNLTLILKNKGK